MSSSAHLSASVPARADFDVPRVADLPVQPPTAANPVAELKRDHFEAVPWLYANYGGAKPTGRQKRWQDRRPLWHISRLERVRKCGRVSVNHIQLNRRLKDDAWRAYYGNLVTCGSIWACPVCASKINAHRSEELSLGLNNWADVRGGTVALLTLTMRHEKGTPLKTYWDALSPAVKASLGGGYRRAREAKKAAGFVGSVMTREATYGANGWHLHAHALVFLENPSAGAVEALSAALFAAWSSQLQRKGLDAPSPRYGIDFQVLTGEQARERAAHYMAKGAFESKRAARELTRDGGKQARLGNRAPLEILHDIAMAQTKGEVDFADVHLWREWEAASYGRQALTWSKGLRDLVGLGLDRPDEDLAEEGLDVLEDEPPFPDGVENIYNMTQETWASVVVHRANGPTDLLELAEQELDLAKARDAVAGRVSSWLYALVESQRE